MHLLDNPAYKIGKDGVIDEPSHIAPSGRKHTRSHASHRRKKRVRTGLIIAASVTAVVVAGTIVFSQLLAPKPDVKFTSATQKVEVAAADAQEEYLCSSDMQSYYSGKMTLEEVVRGKQEPYRPYVLQYHISSDGELLLDGKTYPLDAIAGQIKIDNLKTDRHYTYTIRSIKEIYLENEKN